MQKFHGYDRRPSRRTLSSILGGAFTVMMLATLPAHAQVSLDQLSGVVTSKLTNAQSLPATSENRAAARSGTIRVAIGLRTAAQPAPGAPPSRAAVESAQSRFTSALSIDDGKAARWKLSRLKNLPVIHVTVTAADLEQIAANPDVQYITASIDVQTQLTDSTTLVGMPTAYAAGGTGTGRMVAIIDDGIRNSHAFFGGRVTEEACFVSTGCPANGALTQMTGAGSAAHAAGADHGTHVAGIAAGFQAAGTPANGVAKSSNIMAINVFGPTGAGSADIDLALDHVLDKKTAGLAIDAVNMSLGGGRYMATCDAISPSTTSLIQQLRTAGVATVIASGNNGYTDSVAWPGCIADAITVGNTTKTDAVNDTNFAYAGGPTGSCSLVTNNNRVYCGSNVGSGLVDVYAPGTNITSAISSSNSAFGVKSGTSMAAPHVAGAFAAIRAVVPTATVTQIEQALKNTGTSIVDNRPAVATHRPAGTVTAPRIRVDLALQSLGTSAKAIITAPVAASNINPTTTFTYTNGTGVSSRILYLGTSFGSSNVYNSGVSGTSVSVSNIPAGTIHATLWSLIGANWEYSTYTYTGLGNGAATLTSPAQGSSIDSSATFTYTTGTGVTSRVLYVGTTFGASNVFNSGISGNSVTVPNIPAGTVHVTLWSLIFNVGGSTWTAYTYTYTGTGVAVVTSPAPSTTINPTTAFSLTTGSGVTSKVLYVGTTAGASNIFNSGVSGTSVTVPNIPGGTIHVTLWSLIGSTWHYRTYTYNGVGSTTTAFFTSPALNSTLPPNTVFTWTRVPGAAEYWLQIGSQFALANYFNQSQGTATTTSFSFGAGWAGQPLYTRLWTRIGPTWYLRDYIFYAPTTGAASVETQSMQLSVLAN